MSFSKVPGWDTYNHYGPRKVNEDQIGVSKTAGNFNEMVIEFDAAYLTERLVNGSSRASVLNKIPAGSKVFQVILRVDEAIITDTADKDLYIGTNGSESTNGATFADTDIDDVGTYVVDSGLAGTWAAELAAETEVGIDFEATVTAVTAGSGAIIIQYFKSS